MQMALNSAAAVQFLLRKRVWKPKNATEPHWMGQYNIPSNLLCLTFAPTFDNFHCEWYLSESVRGQSMAFGMKKADLQAISQTKIDDAVLLFENGRYSNAYYLSGYAIEIALKCRIAGQIVSETIPEKNFINRVYTHSIVELVNLAGLGTELKERQKDSFFHTNWGIISTWSPEVRYDVVDKSTAQFFLNAVANKEHGVFEWIKTFW
jgi:HEPN domain-containing protein